ncbi:MAG: septal ring lytic transglycosylase RlpA family protein [Solirubrobacteraceae bacterium]
MYVPVTPAQPAPALAPVGVFSSAPAAVPEPVHTTLSVRKALLNVLDGHTAGVAGALQEGRHHGRSGRLVSLQELRGHRWQTLARTHTRADGRFRLSFTARHLGSERVRLRFTGDAYGRPAHRPLGHLNVYRLAGASWYGGGGGMACGGSLSSSTMGVANKTLPCGTLVTLRYGNRSVRVPVVDRGPYVAGREFDLTEATKRALGFGDTGDVWSTS